MITIVKVEYTDKHGQTLEPIQVFHHEKSLTEYDQEEGDKIIAKMIEEACARLEFDYPYFKECKSGVITLTTEIHDPIEYPREA